jgi:hypothetical protein
MEHYTEKKEYTMSPAKANILSFCFFIPAVLVTWLPYFLIWRVSFFKPEQAKAFLFGLIICMIMSVMSILLHELIHGLCWSLFAPNGWKSVRFGIIWKSLLPYCHCVESLTAKQYRIGLLMPTIVLGLFPIVYGLITGSFFALFYGYIMLLAGSGDLLILGMMRHLSSDTLIKDHPSKIGFMIE